ncbi:helix-turn-helix domain-containing protein [Clostridium thermosuccinogenes]|uniref:helix-turn-helix domain-containing protein n=1 Tax=Clostridium thermosuccinogenes TaxID=84032 RepID=UPI000CA10877|nr:helix-turn-helix transcriptional regulator [Pseudoclostridium thermosuccinogenes]AUS97102.1 hypothetical protein CDO33_12030 [Pseudoclostridium thermosuccinogenes]
MLDLRKIGAYISALRKQKDMTQVELSEMLNVSHQAVSKWERGESMPDIGTLPKLGEIFNKSIDDILNAGEPPVNKACEKDTDITQLVQNEPGKVAEMINNGDVDLQSVIDVAPALKPSIVDEVAQGLDGISIEHLSALAPFLSSDALNKLVDHVIDKSLDAEHLLGIAPFLSKESLDRIVEQIMAGNINGELLAGFAPFVSKDTLDKLADRVIDGTLNGEALLAIAPFIDRNKLDYLVENIPNDRLCEDLLSGFAPFLSREALGRLVDRAIDGSIRAETLLTLAPFLGQENLRKVVRSVSVGNLDGDILAGLAPFIDRDSLSEIVNSMIENAKKQKNALNEKHGEG